MLSIADDYIPALSATRVMATIIPTPLDIAHPLPERYLAEDADLLPMGYPYPHVHNQSESPKMYKDADHEELKRLETACEVWPEDVFPDGH